MKLYILLMNKTIAFSEQLEKYQSTLPYSQSTLQLFAKKVSPHPNQHILPQIMS